MAPEENLQECHGYPACYISILVSSLLWNQCPVCHGLTVQFGLEYALYSINCVFIAFSAVLIIWLLKLKHKQLVDAKAELKVKRILTTVVLLTLLPSIYLAIKLVEEVVFVSKANAFINKELNFPQAHITERSISAAKKQIEVTLIGELVSQEKLKEVEARLVGDGLSKCTLLVHQSKQQTVDVTALKSNIVSELYKDNLYELEEKNKTIRQLNDKLRQPDADNAEWLSISAELNAQYPQIREVMLSKATPWKAGEGADENPKVVVNVKAASKLGKSDRYRITNWLKLRVKSDQVVLIVE